MPRSLRPLLLATLVAGCATSKKDAGPEAWTLAVDNDSYSLEDGNYTNGTVLAWTSREAITYPDPSWVSDVAELNPLASDGDALHVALALGQLIFTPEDLKVANPPLDAHPYAGIVFLDLALVARGRHSLSTTTLRIGAVGDASLAEEFQTESHAIFGAEEPQGWRHQLRDEPLLNLGVERHERLVDLDADWIECDLSGNAGVALGTYLTGVNTGLQLRFGRGLETSLGSQTISSAFETQPLVNAPPEDRFRVFGYLGVEAYALARFLPIDGNAFRDSRSAERRPYVGTATTGLHLQSGTLGLTVAYTLLTDTYEAQSERGEFGTIALSWFW